MVSDIVSVPFAGTIKNDEVVKIECIDWTGTVHHSFTLCPLNTFLGGQIKNNDSADDVKNIDLTKIHYLSGPFEIETAEPGDVLLLKIEDIQAMQEQPLGFTGVFDIFFFVCLIYEIYTKA